MVRHTPVRGVVFSDTHCGSILGLLPPSYKVPDPQSLNLNDAEYEHICRRTLLNKGQAYLWKCWEDEWDWLPEKKLNFAVLNGDGLQGPAKRNSNGLFGLVSPRPSVQASILEQVIVPIRHRFEDFHIVAGTEWHEGEYGEWLAQLAEKTTIDATPYPSGRLVEDMLFLDWEGVLLDIGHDISYFMIYRGTPLEREMNFARIDEALVEGAPDAIIRSHIHTWNLYRNRHGWSLTTPGHMLSIRHARKRTKARGRINDIGLVYLEIYPELKGKEDDYIVVKVRRYNHPKYKAIRREREVPRG